MRLQKLNQLRFSCAVWFWCLMSFSSSANESTQHKAHSADKPPQTQTMYPTGADLSCPLWLADLGVARTHLRRTGCYSSYVGVLVWPNKLRETIPAAGVSRKDHLPGLAQSVKLPELSGLWLGIKTRTHAHNHTHNHTHNKLGSQHNL